MRYSCFFQDDVISVNDLDKLMPAGLGLRYAFLGALETSYLNANGTQEYVDTNGSGHESHSLTCAPSACAYPVTT